MAGDFEIYESMLWEPGSGYFLLERHLARAERSARHFGFALDPDGLRKQLDEFAATLPPVPRKVRFELSRDGSLFIEHVDVKPSVPVRVALAREPVDSADELLRHKTSRREPFTRALAAAPEADDVLLWNERRELTESCAANVVLDLDGGSFTPPLACGVLPGTFRAELLERGAIAERVLAVDDLARATRVRLINSVRRWWDALLPGAS